jgi:hypothetical protein
MKNPTLTLAVIRSRSGRVIAKIVTNHRTGVKTAYDLIGTLKATYNPRTNRTYDHEGVLVSKGDTMVAVVLNCVCAKGVGAVCHPVAVVQS